MLLKGEAQTKVYTNYSTISSHPESVVDTCVPDMASSQNKFIAQETETDLSWESGS